MVRVAIRRKPDSNIRHNYDDDDDDDFLAVSHTAASISLHTAESTFA